MSDKEIVWTCLSCRMRNTSEVPLDAARGKRVDVRCRGCEREQSVSPAVALTPNGKPKRVGVTWL